MNTAKQARDKWAEIRKKLSGDDTPKTTKHKIEGMRTSSLLPTTTLCWLWFDFAFAHFSLLLLTSPSILLGIRQFPSLIPIKTSSMCLADLFSCLGSGDDEAAEESPTIKKAKFKASSKPRAPKGSGKGKGGGKVKKEESDDEAETEGGADEMAV